MNKMSHSSCLLSVYVTFKITDQWGLYHPSTFNLEDIMGVYTHTHISIHTQFSFPMFSLSLGEFTHGLFANWLGKYEFSMKENPAQWHVPVTLPNGKDTSPTSHKKQRKHHDFDFPFLHRKHWKKFYWMCDFKKEL